MKLSTLQPFMLPAWEKNTEEASLDIPRVFLQQAVEANFTESAD
jgi:hypothetical protein